MSSQVETHTRRSDATKTAKHVTRPRGGSNNQAARGHRNARSNRGGRRVNKSDENSASERTNVVKGRQSVEGEDAQGVRTASPLLSQIGGGTPDVCWICAEPVKYYALSECNHRTCHVCALRLRALYKKIDCAFCKEKQDSMIFANSPDALFESYTYEDFLYRDAKLSIYFETLEIMEDSLLLLRFNCPEQECAYMGNGWGDLRLHTRALHGKLMCDLCTRSKKVFSHEHILYPPAMLPLHLPSMNARPRKAALKESVEGGVHPLCEFCRECLFGEDELYAHMRERHEECFICKRNGVLHKYFSNYEALENHFDVDHHPCPHADCLARKFVVFNTNLDLKAHMVEEHGADMTSKDRKDARRIQTDFIFEDGRRGRRDRVGEVDVETSSPHFHQQQAQASNSTAASGQLPTGSRRREGFGAALTGPSTRTNQNVRPPSPTDIGPAETEKHAAFISRLESLAPNPMAAVSAVGAAIRSFRVAESGARDFILTVWNVMDRNLEHTASIINAFVDFLDEEEKKKNILSSWRGFVVEQRGQFPELVPTSWGSGYAAIASSRVLNAKNSTTARSQAVLSRVATAAGSSSSRSLLHTRPQERFPPLSASSSLNAEGRPSQQAGTQNPSKLNNLAATRLRTSPPPTEISQSNKRKPSPKLPTSLFPELPPSSSARTKLQVSGNVSLKNILGNPLPPGAPPWGANGLSTASIGGHTVPEAVQNRPDESGGRAPVKSKKGRGKQKQTLFTLGSFPT